jgi:chemosensory pili system protein ChpA (sensor histidine kinase/response regulator)
MSESQNPNALMGSAQDIAPLAWVIDEIRASLGQAVDSVKAFQADRQDAEPLRNARNQVHQAHGALQLLDLRGVALVTEAIEHLLHRWESEPKECGPSATRTLENAVAATLNYLAGLMSGRPNQPIRLYPYYRDLLALNRAARIHPADLIFPDLSRRPAFHKIEVKPLTANQLRMRRVSFEEGLLGFLRNADDPPARRTMRDAIAELEHLPQRGLARSFWWVARGLLDALAAGQLPVDIDLKRVLARLNLQLRRLIEGGGAVSERLMTDVLYYVGRGSGEVPRVAEVRQLYGLEALIVPDFERPTLTAIDADALRQLKDGVALAKQHWGRIVGGAAELPRFAQELSRCIEAAGRLEAAAIGSVLRNVGVATRDFADLAPGARESLGLEVASALLFVEQSADELPQADSESADRAQQMAQRLAAIVQGRPLPDSAPWMSELARHAQDRLTMTSVVGETRATLREIEQRLDRFFRNPADRRDLPDTDAMFDQICGVLSVLGFEDPVAALRSVQSSVRRLADPATPGNPEEFARIAQNLGAVGFFVDSMAQASDRARGMFRYDPSTGMFTADLAQGTAAAADEVPAPPDDYLAPPHAPESHAATPAEGHPRGEAVEGSVAQQLREAMLTAQRLAATPLDNAALLSLEDLLQTLTGEADLLDDAALKDRIASAQPLLMRLRDERSAAVAEELAQLFAPPEQPAVRLSAPLPATQAAADEELSQIFVEEAQENLDAIDEQLLVLRQAPDDLATMTTLRRAFHTLKGSSRMVGLRQFGDGAWAVEQCFNMWLAQERPASDDLLRLGAAAAALMRGWIARIAQEGAVALQIAPLVQAAQRVREGGAFTLEDDLPEQPPGPDTVPKAAGSSAEAAQAGLPSITTGSAEAAPPPAPGLFGVPDDLGDGDEFFPELDDPLPTADAAGDTTASDEPGSEPPRARVIALPLDGPTRAPAAEETRRIGPLEVSHGLYSVFLNEADECIRVLAQDIAEWRFEPARSALPGTLRRAHSLAGISATVGLKPVHEIADPLDDLLQALVREGSTGRAGPILTPAQFDTLESVVEKMRGMLHQFAAGAFPNPAPVQSAALRTLLDQILERSAGAGPAGSIAFDDDEPTPAVAASPIAPELTAAASAETANAEAREPAEIGMPEEAQGLSGAVGEAPDATASAVVALDPAAAAPPLDEVIELQPLPLEPSGAIAEISMASESTPAALAAAPPAATWGAPVSAPVPADPIAAVDESTLPALDMQTAPDDHRADGLRDVADEAAPANSAVRDEIDPDLLEIFVAEAQDLMPAISGRLRELSSNPNDREVARELMRQLHTVKGSARMAGAMRLGELVHDMETRIESAMQLVSVPAVIVEDLQTEHDRVLALFDALQGRQAGAGAAAVPLASSVPPAAPAAPAAAAAPGEPAPVSDLAVPGEPSPDLPRAAPAGESPIRPAERQATAQPASVIRVRADVLDKLVDQAGEVSIARAKLENELGTLKGALTDLTENISRLRTQLREVEVQADAQIAARADQLSRQSAAFDPLEFDRYTRLQELTRMLAESVEDVAMVQSTMLRGLGGAETDLQSQSRLTRDLQQQLMRVRLVPFANVSERLYRVARQTAKELGKRVNLEIRGGTTEIDRGVLEKLAGPFEHLVRNSIVHGLELPEDRQRAAKPETGEVAIEVRQEGNEIIVVFSDDGAGLNLPRIRSRGQETGLIAANAPVTDRDLMELIFAPGFSTATEVTELAGRGVGMDVVRAELAGFGGRIAVASEPGRGSRFTLFLPLTLAVTQVVLATAGTRRYAIPAGMVEQVRRLKPAAILPALSAGSIDLPPVGQVVLRPLAQLLGEDLVQHQAKQVPVALLRSGEDRLAVAVDDISSNQEVVVKNVGAQVSRLAGILGATILGNGEIVLIINPVQLIARAPEPVPVSLPPALPVAGAGTVGGIDATVLDAPVAAGPVLVMVVDDSLTVRRVTQRLLERNGYDVMLAKDGVDALRQLQDRLPDIMLVDIEMPRMDGFDLTRNLRSGTATRTIPIIMITSRTAEKHRSMAFELGVNEYLGKPYQEDELLRLIRQYAASRVS